MEIRAVPLSPERHKSFYHREVEKNKKQKRAYALFQTYGR